MGKKAVKFGGTSLCNAAQMKKAAEIVHSDQERCVIVVSAPGKRESCDEKMTDILVRCAKTENESERKKLFAIVCERLDDMIRELALPLDFSQDYEQILNDPKAEMLISRGEYFCARIFAALLNFQFVDAADSIYFKEDDTVDTEKTRKTLGEKIRLYEKIVIPGFYGSLPNGDIHIFPRGGSDITGAIAADAADADIYENFTDVPGFLLADPRLVSKPKTVRELSYGEVRRLSSMGASVLHADSILPVYQKKIPIVIRNTNDPNGKSTRIVPVKEGKALGGIVAQKGYTLFSVGGHGIGEDISKFATFLALFGRYTNTVYSTPRSVDACGFLMRTEDISAHQEDILRLLEKEFGALTVSATPGMALVCLVGESAAAENAHILLHTMAEIGAVPLLLDGGADRIGMTVGFSEFYLYTLVQALYDKFEKEID